MHCSLSSACDLHWQCCVGQYIYCIVLRHIFNCISIVFNLWFFMSIELKDHPSCSAVFFLVLNSLRFFQHTFGTHPKQPLPTGYCIGFRAHKRRFWGIANSGCACPRGVARTFLGNSGCFVGPLRNWVGWCLWSLGTWWMGTIVVLYRRCPHLGARFLPFKKKLEVDERWYLAGKVPCQWFWKEMFRSQES